jgi:hypothetical protein
LLLSSLAPNCPHRRIGFLDGHGIQTGLVIMEKTKSTEEKGATGSSPERRSGADRRKGNDPEFFSRGGIERRRGTEERQKDERSST